MAHPRDPVELTLTTTSTRRDGVEHFADPKLGRFDVRIPAGTPYATFGSFMLPAAFSIERPRRVEPGERDFPIIDVAIEHGEPRCVGIRRRPGGPPLSGETLRELPLASFISAAAYGLASERAGGRDGAQVWRRVLGRGARAEFEQGTRPGRGVRLTDEFLTDVAAVYRAAKLHGQPTRKAIAQAFNGSGGSPGRWVQEARRRGFLGPAEGTKAGEQ